VRGAGEFCDDRWVTASSAIGEIGVAVHWLIKETREHIVLYNKDNR
jgi:hypothetical protein